LELIQIPDLEIQVDQQLGKGKRISLFSKNVVKEEPAPEEIVAEDQEARNWAHYGNELIDAISNGNFTKYDSMMKNLKKKIAQAEPKAENKDKPKEGGKGKDPNEEEKKN